MRFLSLTLPILCLLLVNSFFSGCSIQLLQPEQIYSKEFLAKIDSVYAIFKDGDKGGARARLEAMNDSELSSDEKAKKYNLLGVIEFSQVNYDKASEHFKLAKNYVRQDLSLMAQVRLNLAGTYYKQNKYEFAFEEIKIINSEHLPQSDLSKYQQLKLVLATGLGQTKEAVGAMIEIMGQEKDMTAVKNSEHRSSLLENFQKLSDTERVYMLEKNRAKYPLVVAFLAEKEVERRYYSGDKSGAKDVLKWLSSEYRDHPEVLTFIQSFQGRIEAFSKLKMSAIGIVLPFNTSLQKFSMKTLMGIETALANPKTNELNLQLHVEDNKNNPYIAREKVKDLVQKHQVSVIIGGLFPKTATEEYLEARKYGAMFISLSQVDLPRHMKSHLLLEIPGSVQSQLAVATKPEILSRFGKKMAVFYPKSDRGSSYVDEFWALNEREKIEVQGIQGYESQQNDYREPVKHLLGLQFPRERSEELKILNEVYANKDSGPARRTQTLAPVLDFDWVFLPSIPAEAIQIISFFKYFDANDVTFIGGPSWWTSKDLLNEQKKTFGRPLYFIGSDPGVISEKINKDFVERNQRPPGLLETLGFEALALTSDILSVTKPGSRDELESKLIGLQKINSVSGSFKLEDGVWIKDLEMMQIRRGNIEKVNVSHET